MIHEFDTTALARLLAQLSGDLVLVMDAPGRILAAATGQDTPVAAAASGWVGRLWADIVAPDSRHKVDRMLREVATAGQARRRELNHPLQSGGWAAFAYHAARLEGTQVYLAMGRDLSAQSALQQRLLQAQREAQAAGLA